MFSEEIWEKGELEGELWRMARVDSLTGLANRLYFNEQLSALVERAKVDGQSFAVGLVDLDRFKDINDLFGHDAGDMLLKDVARRLETAVGPFGSVARLGGDEFAVLIVTTPALQGSMEAMFAAMNEPVMLAGVPRRVSISAGLSTFPADAATPSDLLKNADLALRRSKERGGERYELFDISMRLSARARDQLHQSIEEALDTGSFCLVYQPIISAGDQPPVSFEALLRWKHPQRGFLSPTAFEDIFDDPMMASCIGKWVIDRAIAQAAEWQRAGHDFGRVAVNVTTADFAVGGLAEYVQGKLAEHGQGPERLCIEVTEHVFLGRDAVNVTETLDKLHAMGVEIALDDFGTGYASLSHVKKFPIGRLKVDKAFVHDMEDRPDDLAIVLSIIQLGESLGIKVTAEGVETEDQLRLLRSMGCGCFQGYFFSKPLDPRDVPGFLGDVVQALVA